MIDEILKQLNSVFDAYDLFYHSSNSEMFEFTYQKDDYLFLIKENTNMKVLFLRNQIDIITLLSSTTYKTNFFDKCIYCHKDVENDYYDYKGKIVGMPYRCNCEKSQEELKAKESLLEKLISLQEDIDTETINKATKQAIINKIDRAYEEECQRILYDIIDQK